MRQPSPECCGTTVLLLERGQWLMATQLTAAPAAARAGATPVGGFGLRCDVDADTWEYRGRGLGYGISMCRVGAH